MEQNGERVTGKIDATGGRRDLQNSKVIGTFRDGSLDLKIPETGGFVKATVSGNKMSGRVQGWGSVAVDFEAILAK